MKYLNNVDQYIAIIITAYILSLSVYIYYIYLFDKKKGVLTRFEKRIYTVSIFSLILIPYIGCIYSIIDNNQTNNYIQFIILNSIIVSLFLLMIIFKDTIIPHIGFNSVLFTTSSSWLDDKEYDQNLKKNIVITDENKLKIRKRAGESEYRERILMEEDIYA
tara:strand:- start:573 stop:1058 length:486 start_codon:yes stop_codon:yes gene_type:complete